MNNYTSELILNVHPTSEDPYWDPLRYLLAPHTGPPASDQPPLRWDFPRGDLWDLGIIGSHKLDDASMMPSGARHFLASSCLHNGYESI